MVDIDSFEVQEYKDAALLMQSPVEYINKKLTDLGADHEMDKEDALTMMSELYEILQSDVALIAGHETMGNIEEDIDFLCKKGFLGHDSWRVVIRLFLEAGITTDLVEEFLEHHESDGKKESEMQVRVLKGILQSELGKEEMAEEVDLSAVYEDAKLFLADPVTHLSELKARFAGIYVAEEVMNRLADYGSALTGEEVKTDNSYVRVWLTHDPGSTESIAAIFTLLKEAGFTYAEMKTWLTIEEGELDEEEELDAGDKMMVNTMKVILDAIYDEE